MTNSTPLPSTADPIRILVVDDSVVIRGFINRWLGEAPGCAVVSAAANGAQAVREAARTDPDVVVLDIEMPEMDGLSALPLILKEARFARVLMSSTLTRQGAEVTLRALSLGATDYLAKPSSVREKDTVEVFRRDLLAKVRALGEAAHRARRFSAPGASRPAAPPSAVRPAAEPPHAAEAPSRRAAERPAEPPSLRPFSKLRPEVVAIGSSTGGPQALIALLGPLAARIRQPILITQHMPVTFTAILAEHLARATGVPAAEGQQDEPVTGGRIYVAPGDHHMTVGRLGAARVIKLNRDPPENFCRPSVEPMFRSIAAEYAAAALGVMLTGMGHDGLDASRRLVEGGATLIAQDEASSVVWGMPGAVANAGLCSAVAPLSEIGALILRAAGTAR